MPAPKTGIVIDNLASFQRDLKIAATASSRLLSAGLRKAGVPVVGRARSVAAKRTGAMAAGYRVSTRGTAAYVVNKVPYAAGAEWGRLGKWSGFGKYGMPGQRFAARAVEELEEVIAETITRELQDTVSMLGWARP